MFYLNDNTGVKDNSGSIKLFYPFVDEGLPGFDWFDKRWVYPLTTTTTSLNLATQGLFADKGDHYEVVLNLPGVPKSNVTIEVDDKEATLTVTGTKTRDNTSIRNSLSLPKDAGEIKATLENGELVIHVTKLKTKRNILLA